MIVMSVNGDTQNKNNLMTYSLLYTLALKKGENYTKIPGIFLHTVLVQSLSIHIWGPEDFWHAYQESLKIIISL